MTVGELREFLAKHDLPDDAPVLVERESEQYSHDDPNRVFEDDVAGLKVEVFSTGYQKLVVCIDVA